MLNKIFGKNKNPNKKTSQDSIKSGSVTDLLYSKKVEKKVEKTTTDSEQQVESPIISDLELKAISSPDSLNGLTEDQINKFPTDLQSLIRDSAKVDNDSSNPEISNNLSKQTPDQLLPLFESFLDNYDFSNFTVGEIPKNSLSEEQMIAYYKSIYTLITNIAELEILGLQDLAKSFDSALKKLGIEGIDSKGEILDDKKIRIIINKLDPKSIAMHSALVLVPALASYSAVMLYYIAPTVFTIGASAGLGALTVKYIKSKIEENKSNNPETIIEGIQNASVRAILYPNLANKSS